MSTPKKSKGTKKINPAFRAILEQAKRKEALNNIKSKVIDDDFVVYKVCKDRSGNDYTIQDEL
jgi:hypothetical protein